MRTVPLSDSFAPTIQEFQVAVLGPEGLERTVTSSGEKLVIGTHESAGLCIDDDTVSRFHCEIGVENGQLVLRDFGSTNGTAVDGTRVLVAVLEHESKITVGKTDLLFSLGGKRQIDLDADTNSIGSLSSKSPPMQAVIRHLQKAASTDATTLLFGETGTGKDVCAHAIHQASARTNESLVVVDCGSLPGELIESELFGHVKGAFTGAHEDRPGAFEQAQGGTVFLDEIGEIPLHLQTRFLRVIESRETQRVGSNTKISLDLRVIGATHRDLRKQVNEGTFREDLYHRLAIIEIHLPPLRERLEDLPDLVDVLLENLDISIRGRALMTSDTFLQKLRRHDWPGNIRELRNYLERCAAMQESMPLQQERRDSALRIHTDVPIRIARTRWLQHLERKYLEELLTQENGNVSAVARRAGVNRVHMYRLLKTAGLR
jgi:DNA-binding NtrC family response regulator